MDGKVILDVEGMTCNSCAQGITRHLSRKGMKDVVVNYEEGKVELPEQGVPIEEIISEINSLGYKAYSKGAVKKKDPVKKLQQLFLLCLFFTVPLLLHMFIDLPLLHNGIVQFLLALPVMFTGLFWFGKSAWGSLKNLQPNMDVLIMTGSLAAFIYSTAGLVLYGSHSGNYLFFETAAAIITFVLLGNLIEHRSLKKTTEAVTSLLYLQPLTAKKISNALTDSESVSEVGIDRVHSNDLLLVNTGDRIPADGLIYWGFASIDESAMTGEYLPAEKTVDDTVLAGTIVLRGSIKIIVKAAGNATVLNNVIALVRQATTHKPAIQRLGDKVSSWFVPVVLFLALLTFLLSYFLLSVGLTASIMRSIAVLVISCPCAMGLATPTAVAVAIGRATKEGILIKGGHLLETFSTVKTIFFDKTGTLTEATPFIKSSSFKTDKEEVLYLIHTLEKHSTHPVAKALCKLQQPEKYSPIHFTSIEEEKGFGIHATDSDSNRYYIGNSRRQRGTDGEQYVHVLKNDTLLATFELGENIRAEAKEVISYFKTKGIKTIILSGDSDKACRSVNEIIGADEIYAQRLPHEKSELIRRAGKDGKVAMVGDGINDAPSLAVADVAISFGSATQVAMQTAGIIIMNVNHLEPIVRAHRISEAALVTIRQNLFWALIYNVVAIPVAAAGYLSPVLSSFSMAFSDVIVIGNSLRLRIKNIFGKKSAA